MNCHECKYPEEVPGNAHIKCTHPFNILNPEGIMTLLGVSAKGHQDNKEEESELYIDCNFSIKFNTRAVRKGWFYFPFLFDPIWLKSCSGFIEKEKEQNETE